MKTNQKFFWWAKLVGSFIAGFAACIAAFFVALSYFDDRPKINAKLSVSPPLYSYSESSKWSSKELQPLIDHYFNVLLSQISIDYLISNKLAEENSGELLSKKEKYLLEKFNTIKTRIPINITIANNGKRDTTIISCKIRIFGIGYGTETESHNLMNIRKQIKVGEVVDISRNIDMPGIPESIAVEMISNELSIKLTNNSDDKKLFQDTVPAFVKKLYSIESGTSWNNIPYQVEVIVEDQFGNRSTDISGIMENIQ